MTEFPLCSIVIPALGHQELLWQVLDCLHRTDLSQAEVIVVFNGRPQDREKVGNVLASRFPAVRWVCSSESYGMARACHLGARTGQGRFVAFLHDDVLIHEFGWLAQLTDLLNRRLDIGLAGGGEPKDNDRSSTELVEVEPGVVECDGFPTISVVRRYDICAFDEFYVAGWEEKDWALAFRRKGLKVVCRKIAHTHAGTTRASSLFLNGRCLLEDDFKEGARERDFLTKNKDALSVAYPPVGWKKGPDRDRDGRKARWLKRHLHSFVLRLAQKTPIALEVSMKGLAFVLPLSIALSNVLWGVSLLLWGVASLTNRSRYRWTGLELPYLAGLGIACLATLTSPHALHGFYSLRSEILIAVFVLAAQTGTRENAQKRLMFFSVGAVVAACLGLLQWTIGHEWNSVLGIGALPEKLRFLPSSVARLFSLHAGRAHGFYNHPITFAEMLLLSGGGLLGFWLVERTFFWVAAGAIVGGAILFSQTRSVWMAMFLMLGAWAIIKKEKKVMATALILVAIFGVCLGMSPTLRGRAASIVDTQQNRSNLIRMGLWDKSLGLIRKNPALGIGSGNFLVKGADLRWGGSPPEEKWTETHSIYLQNAVERGLIGFTVFLWFLGAIGKRMWQAARLNPINGGLFFGFIGLLMAGFTESWTNDSEIVMCVYFLVGTAWALGNSSLQTSHSNLKVI